MLRPITGVLVAGVCAAAAHASPVRFEGSLSGDSVVLDARGVPLAAAPGSLDFAFNGTLRHSDPLTPEWDTVMDDALTTLKENPLCVGTPPTSATIFSAPLMASEITSMSGDVSSESVGPGRWRHDIVLTLEMRTTFFDAPGGAPVGIFLGVGHFLGSLETETPGFVEFFDAATVRYAAIQFASDGPFVLNEAGGARSDPISWVFPVSTFTLTVPAPGVLALGGIGLGMVPRRRR